MSIPTIVRKFASTIVTALVVAVVPMLALNPQPLPPGPSGLDFLLGF
jgi:hypothetical protein